MVVSEEMRITARMLVKRGEEEGAAVFLIPF